MTRKTEKTKTKNQKTKPKKKRSRSTSPKRNEREEEEEGETPPSPEREIISLYLSSPPFCPSDTPTLSPSLPGALSPNLSSTPLSLPESASFRSEKKKEIYFHPPIIGNVNLAFDYAHYDSLDLYVFFLSFFLFNKLLTFCFSNNYYFTL